MIAIRGVAHFSIPVRDTAKSTKFYTEIVGCRHLSTTPNGQMVFLGRALPGSRRAQSRRHDARRRGPFLLRPLAVAARQTVHFGGDIASARAGSGYRDGCSSASCQSGRHQGSASKPSASSRRGSKVSTSGSSAPAADRGR
jgi:catechol 2,3-dioxygenase-like lactoylglutathione lyase family enzyme